MASAPKTAPTDSSVPEFLNAVADPQQRAEALELDALLARWVGEPGRMWGASIVGYGTKPITYADGRVEDWMAIGFAARSGKFAIYGLGDIEHRDELLAQLGRASSAKACVYVPRLADVDIEILETMVRAALEATPHKGAKQ